MHSHHLLIEMFITKCCISEHGTIWERGDVEVPPAALDVVWLSYPGWLCFKLAFFDVHACMKNQPYIHIAFQNIKLHSEHQKSRNKVTIDKVLWNGNISGFSILIQNGLLIFYGYSGI